MRRLAVLGVGAAWVTACFSSSDQKAADAASDVPLANFDAASDGPGDEAPGLEAAAPEAGGDATVEASTDAAAEASADAPGDAPKDAPFDSAPPPVIVTVLGAAGPEPGVPVVFQDAAGAVLGEVPTDHFGQALMLMPSGGSATVALGAAASPRLTTVLGLRSGDKPVVPDWGSAPAVTANLAAVPTKPALTGVAGYAWFTGAGSPSMFPGLPFQRSLGGVPSDYGIGQFGAVVGAALPSLVEARTAAGVVLGWAAVRDQPLLARDDAGLLDVAIGGSWSTKLVTENVQVTLPDGGSGVSVVALGEAADGVLLPLWGLPFETHPGFADFVQAEAQLGGFSQIVAVRAPPPSAPGTLTIDATSAADRVSVTNATVTLPSPGQAQVSWTLSGGTLGAATGLVALTSWSDGTRTGTWTLVAPGTSGSSLRAPPVPSAAKAYFPKGSATIQLDTFYAVTGQTGVPSYADFVAMAGQLRPLSGCVTGPFMPPLPAAGKALLYIFAPAATGC